MVNRCIPSYCKCWLQEAYINSFLRIILSQWESFYLEITGVSCSLLKYFTQMTGCYGGTKSCTLTSVWDSTEVSFLSGAPCRLRERLGSSWPHFFAKLPLLFYPVLLTSLQISLIGIHSINDSHKSPDLRLCLLGNSVQNTNSSFFLLCLVPCLYSKKSLLTSGRADFLLYLFSGAL